MTTSAEMLALADRVEREEPSAALDVAIADALGEIGRWSKSTGLFESAGISRGITYRGLSYTMTATWWAPDALRHDPDSAQDVAELLSKHGSGIPAYTISLDAAVTLASGLGSWEVSAPGAASVTVLCGRFLVSEDIERHATGHTPAAALTAAALRARAATMPEKGPTP